MNDLKNKVAIITGGASGIGRSVAELFALQNISALTIADLQSDLMHELSINLEKRFDSKVLISKTDVSDQVAVNQMVQQTIDCFGQVDILVNNAGICPMVPWEETTLENWNQLLSVNLTSAFLCSQAVLPYMREKKYGRLIHISSVGAFIGSVTGHVAYGVSKAGIIALSKYLAKQFASEGILSNVISPGSIDTPITESFGEENKKRYREASPLKRQGTSQELAEAVLFLSGSGSSYITGSTIHVNGGSLLI
tara:strand:- start:977 stop:1732 length:756 start_codon:yes stop_codon:yes gene_type:complete